MCESEPRAPVTEEERREAEQLETELDKYFFTVFDGSSPEDVSHAKQLWTSLSLLPPLESRLVNADIRQRLPIAPINHDETLLVVDTNAALKPSSSDHRETLQEVRHQKQRQEDRLQEVRHQKQRQEDRLQEVRHQKQRQEDRLQEVRHQKQRQEDRLQEVRHQKQRQEDRLQEVRHQKQRQEDRLQEVRHQKQRQEERQRYMDMARQREEIINMLHQQRQKRIQVKHTHTHTHTHSVVLLYL
uniref:Cilia- and flagella-associated protein HOATZ n=1 Tax=Salmo trutta TaxID=8032 RepID=A0A673ZZR9_SALTR